MKFPHILHLLFLGVYLIFGANADVCGGFTENPRELRERAPWVAAIFLKSSSSGDWTYLCGATITSPTSVITTANCVQSIIDKGVRKVHVHLRYSALRVVAGLRSANFLDRDAHTQEVGVAQIREHRVPAQKGVTYHQLYDRIVNLAGVRLLAPLNLTSFVSPVCLVEVPNSVQELLTTAPGEVVILAGYGHDLQQQGVTITQLKLTSIRDCVHKYSYTYHNVVCGEAKETNTSMSTRTGVIPCDMEGHGMIVRTDREETGREKFYLMGVYTGNSARLNRESPDYPAFDKDGGNCSAKDVVFFTKYGEHYRWAISHFYHGEDLLTCHSDSARPIEELCNGKVNCDDGSDESFEICYAQKDCTENQFRCEYGACVNKTVECDKNLDCADGSDEDEKTVQR